MTDPSRTAVIEVAGVQWASSKSIVEAVQSRRPGVISVDVDPVSQTATINYDPDRTSVAAGQNLGRAIGYNAVALPFADGSSSRCSPLVLSPEIAALTMSGSSRGRACWWRSTPYCSTARPSGGIAGRHRRAEGGHRGRTVGIGP